MNPKNNASIAHRPKTEAVVRGLGWFSIALGLAEVFMPRMMARTLGMQGQEALLRAHGIREIINGVGILSTCNPKPWIWGRVAGDAFTISTLVFNARSDGTQKSNLIIALGAVAGLAALDVLTAKSLGVADKSPTGIDSNDLNGLLKLPVSVRGLALNDFHIPPDVRAPKLLQTKPIQLH